VVGMIDKKKLLKAIKQIVKKASVELPEPVIQRLNQAYINENSEPAKTILSSILENVDLAKKLNRPICQDTGVPIFYVEIGKNFKIDFDIEDILKTAIRESTKGVPLRPNAVDPLTDENTNDNTGRFIPFINYELKDNDKLKITYFPKGAGSENQSHLFMLNPSDGLNRVKKVVYDWVVSKVAQSCPPVIVGIGIGGGSDIALQLAKKALLRDIDEKNPVYEIQKLEDNILSMINESGIGPMGLGGKATALAVHIEYAHRHPASFPLGIILQCWSARKAALIIDNNGNIKIL
jgi:fumarate hydratase subunit alpha